MAALEERKYGEVQEFAKVFYNTTLEYEGYEEYMEHKEFDEEFNHDRDIAKGHITFQFKVDREDEDYKLQEVQCPVLRGGCNQDEFQAFTQQWSLYRGYHSGMDEREL